MRYIYIITICLIAIACEKDIEIEIPMQQPVLVVNAIFNNDSIWKVQVSKSMPVKTPDSFITYFNNAIVNIHDSAGNQIETLEYSGGNYISPSGKKPLISRKYQISVQSDGFQTASAKSYIPDSISFKEIKITKGLSIDKRYNTMADFLLFEAVLSDNPNTNNYYMLEFICTGKYYSFSKMEIEGNDNYFETFPSTVSQQQRVFFSDETFNGQEKIIKLKSNIGSLAFTGLPLEIFPDCYLRLYSVSEQLYKYLISYYRQVDSNEYEYTNNPIRVDNNIVNGLGIFGGYTNKDNLIDKNSVYNLLQ